MDNLCKVWNLADELHNDNYGNEFIEMLEHYLQLNTISENEAKSLIRCLIDADEIRDIFSKEIMSLLRSALETDYPIFELISFINQSCEDFTSDISQDYFKIRFDKISKHINNRCNSHGETFKLSKFTLILPYEDVYIFYNTLYKTNIVIPNIYKEDILFLIKNKKLNKKSKIFNILKDSNLIVLSQIDEDSLSDIVMTNTICQKSRVLTLTIKTTMSCNLNCAYCWQTPEVGVIENDVQEAIVNLISKKSVACNRIVISWFGGEPMLGYSAITNIMNETKKIALRYKIPYVGLMSTNGTLLNSQRIKEMMKLHIYSYQVTLDGLKEQHDKLRPFKNSTESSFEKIVQNLRDIRDNVRSNQLEIIIRVNISESTKDCIFNFIDFFQEEFGYDSKFKLSFEMVSNRGGEKVKKMENELLGDLSYKEVLTKKVLLDNKITMFPLNFEHGSMACEFLNPNSYNINYDGSIYACELLSDRKNDSSNIIGWLNKDGTINYNLSNVAFWKKYPQLSMCKDCVLYPICLGGLCPKGQKSNAQCNYLDSMETIYNSMIQKYLNNEYSSFI